MPNKGCAFIKFVELDSAIQAYNTMQRAIIHGQHIKVGWGKARLEPMTLANIDRLNQDLKIMKMDLHLHVICGLETSIQKQTKINFEEFLAVTDLSIVFVS